MPGHSDPATGILTYVNAGHEPPVVVGLHGIKALLQPTGPAVGLLADMDFEAEQAQLDPGDILVAFTDGITEAQDGGGAFYTEERLHALLTPPAGSAADILATIEADARAHIGDVAQSDDITMLAVRRDARSPDTGH